MKPLTEIERLRVFLLVANKAMRFREAAKLLGIPIGSYFDAERRADDAALVMVKERENANV